MKKVITYLTLIFIVVTMQAKPHTESIFYSTSSKAPSVSSTLKNIEAISNYDDLVAQDGHQVNAYAGPDPDIDFSSAIRSVSSGNWSDPGIWQGGSVPAYSDNVIIDNGHDVYIDLQGANSGDRVDLCHHLKIDQYATLFMGHNNNDFLKALQINGSLICEGTFSSGRQRPGGSGDGSIYTQNARIYLNLQEDTTYISGTGYFHPRTLICFSPGGARALTISHQNLVTDKNFVIKSNDNVSAIITREAYLNIKENIGLTGSTYQWSSDNAQADLTIAGVVVTNNVGLFTKNTEAGSALTITEEGSLFVQSVNEGKSSKSEAGGFKLTVENNGLFRCGEFCRNPVDIAASDMNMTVVNNGEIREYYTQTMPAKSEILNQVNQYKPTVNPNTEEVANIFGASHIAGWYHFTDRPFLLEGLDYYRRFGSTALKTTLTTTNNKMYLAYHFNHTWPNFDRLVDVAEHYMLDSLFRRSHIKTHTFWVTSTNKGFYKDGPDFNHEVFWDEEQQYYELTKYLLETYGDLDKKFVYQNWEGDWMLRGPNKKWEEEPHTIPDDVEWQVAGMARMFRARQRGTERARNEFPNTTAQVLHGIELNKVWDKLGGQYMYVKDTVPCVVEDVLPHTRIDISSWSAYDGRWSDAENNFPIAFWHGLEQVNYFTNPTTKITQGIPVQVGEFAINENPKFSNYTGAEIRDSYDKLVGMALAMGIQNFYLWNLYCSGQQSVQLSRETEYETSYLYNVLDGKWVIEPDGTWGAAAQFLMEYFPNASTAIAPSNIYAEVKIIQQDNRLQIASPYQQTLISIFDINGRLLKTTHYEQGQSINISSLTRGYYILRLQTPTEQVTKKFLKWN